MVTLAGQVQVLRQLRKVLPPQPDLLAVFLTRKIYWLRLILALEKPILVLKQQSELKMNCIHLKK